MNIEFGEASFRYPMINAQTRTEVMPTPAETAIAMTSALAQSIPPSPFSQSNEIPVMDASEPTVFRMSKNEIFLV